MSFRYICVIPGFLSPPILTYNLFFFYLKANLGLVIVCQTRPLRLIDKSYFKSRNLRTFSQLRAPKGRQLIESEYRKITLSFSIDADFLWDKVKAKDGWFKAHDRPKAFLTFSSLVHVPRRNGSMMRFVFLICVWLRCNTAGKNHGTAILILYVLSLQRARCASRSIFYAE